jgi:DnaJ-class molecular chaperone
MVEVRTPTDLSDRERALLQELAKLQRSRLHNDIPNEQKSDVHDV